MLEEMSDVNDRRPVRLEPRDDLVQPGNLIRRQRGGGLVHDDDLGPASYGPQNLDFLPLRDAQRAHDSVRIDAKTAAAFELPVPRDLRAP